MLFTLNFTELSKISQCFNTELKKMSNIYFLPDHHLLLKNNQQWQNFWMIYNMTMIRNKFFCLPASYDIITFCVWRDNSFPLHFKAIEKSLEKCGRKVFRNCFTYCGFWDIKKWDFPSCQIVTVVSLSMYPQFKLWLHTI